MAERRSRAVAAGHTGDAAAAVAALADEDPGVRAAALGAILRSGALSGALLQAGLRDPDVAVRRRACRIAARTDLALDALVERLDDAEDTVVEEACAACGERADLTATGVIRLAELATDHTDALVREAAVAALGSLAGEGRVGELGLEPRIIEVVVAAADDVAAVRRRVAVATAAFDDPRVDDVLTRLAGDRDLQVRQIAEDLRSPDDVTGDVTDDATEDPATRPSPVRIRPRRRDADDPAP